MRKFPFPLLRIRGATGKKILTIFAILIFYQAAQPSVVFGRELTWDQSGLCPLNIDGPLSSEEDSCLTLFKRGEFSRAESQARNLTERRTERFLGPWILIQIARIRKQSAAEVKYFDALARKYGEKPSILYGQYKSISLAMAQFDGPSTSLVTGPFADLSRKAQRHRDSLRLLSDKYLPILVAVTQDWRADFVQARGDIKAFIDGHKRGPDARILLCRAYCIGVVITRNGKTKPLEIDPRPEEPKPKQAIAIADELLKDNPSFGPAVFYKARAYFKLGQVEKSVSLMRHFLELGGDYVSLRDNASDFIKQPSEGAFSRPIIE